MQFATQNMEDFKGTLLTVVISAMTLVITNMDLLSSILSSVLTTITIFFVLFKFYVWLNKEFKEFREYQKTKNK